MDNPNEENIYKNIDNIYLYEGNSKDSWINLIIDINDENKNEKNISYIKNKLLQKQNNELTLDIIDFIIEKGTKTIIDIIFKEDFFNILINTIIDDNTNINIQQKFLFLIQKWINKFNEENIKYEILIEIYNKFKNEGKEFPQTILQTYDKYIQFKENDINEKKEVINLDNIKSELNNIEISTLLTPLENPFDDNSDNSLPNVDFPENIKYANKFSDLEITEIPLYLKTLRSKSIIENTDNIQKLSQLQNQNNHLHNINEENDDNDYDNGNEIKNCHTQKITNMNELFKKLNHNQNNDFVPTSTYKNYRANPALFQNKWKDKISLLNKWIKEGKNSKNFDNLKQGISQLLIGLDEIEDIILNCAKIGDNESRNTISYIKSDMEQTCYRYECLIQGKKVEKFKSAFDGNVKKYYFYKDNLIEENNNININVIEGEGPKKEKKMKKFGKAIKNSFHKIGQKIGGKSKSKSKDKKKKNCEELGDFGSLNIEENK